LIVIVVLALGLALGIQAWIVKPYKIPSGSMEPTLDVGQRVLVNRFIYHLHEPSIGDIVVFHPPEGAETAAECGVDVSGREPCPKPTPQESSQNFIKRIVAVGGDTLSIKGGHPVVDGIEKKDEPYTNPCGSASVCNMPKAIKIPEGLFLHDGRQPRRQRRQPLLGSGAEVVDHRRGVLHLLAARPDRHPLGVLRLFHRESRP
jgi:signal peptidase I